MYVCIYLYNVYVRDFGARRNHGTLQCPLGRPTGVSTACPGPCPACLGLNTAIPGPQYCIPWPPGLLQSAPETSQRHFRGASGVPAGTKLTCPPGLPDLPGPQYCLPGPQYCLKDFLRTAETSA